MKKSNVRSVFNRFCFALSALLLPAICMGYTMGDINSDDKIDLRESIYSLQVAAGTVIPLSGTTINVPSQIPTIQKAIDAASNGDTIAIAAGDFHESLTIEGKSLAIIGAGNASTTINGDAATVITIKNSPGVSIQHLTVQNGEKGIYASNNTHVEISQVIVKNCSDRGIQIDNNSNGEISDSAIQSNGRDGIGVLRNSNAYMTGNVTTADNSRYGVQLFQGSAVLIDGSTFASNGNTGSGISINYNSTLYVATSSLSLSANHTEGLQAGTSSSVGISADSSLLVDNNTGLGIAMYGTSRFYSEGVISVQGSGGNGIEVGGSSDLNLKGNTTISNCSGEGITLFRSSTALVAARLEISNCVDNGISVFLGSTFNNNDSANIIINNITGGATGISVVENSAFRANGGILQITNNSGYGFNVGRNSTLALRSRGTGLNASIKENGVGIELYQGGVLRTDAIISISQNTGEGLVVSDNSVAFIKNITIENNGGWGVRVYKGGDLTIYDSKIQTNHGGNILNNDISLSFGSRSSLYNNTIGSLFCDSSVISQGSTLCSN